MMQTARDIIRSFLDLPVEAFPSVYFENEKMEGSAWTMLRDYLLPADQRAYSYWGEVVVLRAARKEWCGGVKVALI